MSKAIQEESVVSVRHWTDDLFSFSTTRDPAFRFLNGQFTMIGLKVENKPLLRAYSMTSANYEDHLEFFSIKVQNGPLTSRLQHVQEGDKLLVSQKPTGTLVQDSLIPGRHLYLFSTGTGIAPFCSIIKDPEVYERFEKIVLIHGCRRVADLAYGGLVVQQTLEHELIGEIVRPKLLYYPTTTREASRYTGRITDLVQSAKLFEDLDISPLDKERDRVMLCGSPMMLADCVALLEQSGFQEGSQSKPGQFVIEKAFVEK
ncbi:ferredoxin--NADP reductase [Algihabitans albus]|uniref:ferredoxin--NADP reductase n=1 Tax=Algihabitans albus TaxID=2164067 RepID=UPI000E5D1173|nr:ferredoxin--NADP reductase [Algihabitans albus]